ncbi:MAG: YidC/Oxa1 family membrane protein insertase [Clostridiales bacterium]|nr:YidC/Oxa1 family membrane protein insertase [Clostridiales bacterium]
MQIFNLINILPFVLTDEPQKATGIPGFLGGFIELLFKLTEALHIPSYALALFLFTIVVKMLLFPLTLKQMLSTRSMQKLQPLMKEISEKYKNDPQKKNEATMKLYQDYKINPLAGCLPLLIQMPIIIALFYTVRGFVPGSELGHGFLWIKDLFEVVGETTDKNGNFLPILLKTPVWLAVLVAASQFGQQFLTITNRKDQTQRIMLFAMPVFIGFVASGFPAALALYWTFQSIIGAVQQLFINARGKKEDAELEAKIKLEAEKMSKKKEKAQAEAQKKPKKWYPPGSPEAEEENRREEAERKKQQKKDQGGNNQGKKYKIVRKK